MTIGSTISHYKILEKLGEGGMGVVYKAEDTKLERSVALKFLAAHLLDDDEAKQRFLREAKAAAALDHPNICTVYEIAEAEGKTFLAMAFLKGETLEDRIAKGPLPLKDALDIGRQVAEGLQAAHAEGIVHRDIKPANILISPEGRATIMDFGLARLTEASRLTKADQTVGTAAYMSPEQMEGAEVDHRTDIWALGCVLYEMVAGVRTFQGEYAQALAYEIVNQAPEPLTAVRAGVPMELEFVVGKCLEKDTASRYQNASEIAVDLRNLQDKLKSGRSTILRTADMTGAIPAAASQTLTSAQALPPGSVVMPRSKERALQAVAALATLAMLILGSLYFFQAAPDVSEKLVRRFSFSQQGLGRSAISPDGRYIAFAARTDAGSSIWLRPVGSEATREIAGTEGARSNQPPAWSPDSRSLVFATQKQLKRISIDGGEATILCELPTGFQGVAWSPDGERIAFASGFDLWEISARGGEPRLLFESEPGHYHQDPHFLPSDDSSRILLYSASAGYDPRIEALDMETGERRDVDAGSAPVYAPSGHLLYRRDRGLWAMPFSTETLTSTGEAFPVAEAAVGPSVARDGTLVYTDARESTVFHVAIRDRTGAILRTVGEPIANGWPPSVAPGGRSIAISTRGDIWVFDLERDIGNRLTTSSDNEALPAWFASGEEVSYLALAAGRLTSQSADGSGDPRVLLEGVSSAFDWSPDERYLAYGTRLFSAEGRQNGLWYREHRTDGSFSEPVTFLNTSVFAGMPQFSNDGRYLAYVSDESGRGEVYVRPFPDGPGRWRISTNGGTQPRWSADGTELFYVEGETLMAAPLSSSPNFTVGQPERLFDYGSLRGGNGWRYDVFPDGRRFATTARVEDGHEQPATVRIVENWYEEFRDREKD